MSDYFVPTRSSSRGSECSNGFVNGLYRWHARNDETDDESPPPTVDDSTILRSPQVFVHIFRNTFLFKKINIIYINILFFIFIPVFRRRFILSIRPGIQLSLNSAFIHIAVEIAFTRYIYKYETDEVCVRKENIVIFTRNRFCFSLFSILPLLNTPTR